MKAKNLLADGFQVLIVRVLNLVCTAGISILVSRALGPEGRGTYIVPSMLAGLVATLFAGLTTTVASSMLKDRSGRGALGSAFMSAIPMVAVGAVVLGAITILTHELWALPYAILVLPFMAMSAIANGYGYGVKNVRLVTTLSLATSIAILIFVAAGLFFIGRSASVAIIMWFGANVIVGIVAVSIVLWHSRRLPTAPTPRWPFLAYALRVGATGIVSILNYRIDLYMVAFFTTPAELGFYATAVSAAETLLVAAQVGSIVTVPHIGSLPPGEAASFTARCVRNNFAVISLCCIIAALLAPTVVYFLFGPSFLPAVTPLRILLIGIVPMSAASIISSYYTLNAKKPHVPLVIAGISAIICAGVALALLPRFGIAGAAIGTTISYVSSVAISIALFSAQTKISPLRIVCIQFDDIRGYRRVIGGLRPSSDAAVK